MEKYLKLLKNAKNVAIFSHSNPDPDTIGSSLALSELLKSKGKNIQLFCDTEINSSYMFLRECENYSSEITESLDSFDILIAVDVATLSMLGKFEEQFLKHPNTLRIDHHINGDNFALINQVFNVSACAIAIFDIACKLRWKFTEDIATQIYFGICGDTGIFRNTNTDSKTFEVCAKLLTLGAECRKVYKEFFDKKTVSYVKMSSSVLLDAKLNDELGYGILIAKKSDYEKFDMPEDDNLGNLPHTYLNCGYKIAVILKEKSDGIHCSFRSKFEYDVSVIAQKFGGGGHKNASGCLIDDSLENSIKLVEKEIQNYLNNNT